ncbi:MAG: ribulose-phosphate 3-epimerase [Dehalococcoidia bacterium]|nr:MAG: ribulose-phosphate 3-epimerase [Dehalococcoidia bacterium]
MMNRINRIVPAILTVSPAALVSMLRQAECFADWVQIDIMDGLFVPPVSITSQDIAGAGVKIGWEAHLMVKDPEKYIGDFHLAGAKRIVVHYEAVKEAASDVIEHITSLGMSASLAVNPETPLEVLRDNLVSRLESVLFLAVHPGYYGAKFIPEVLDKIHQFRHLCPDISIGIDGGIKAGNITRVAQSGVNEICVGSAIFSQPDPAASFRELTALARIGWRKQTGA